MATHADIVASFDSHFSHSGCVVEGVDAASAAGLDIVGVARLIKVGKSLAVGEVSLYSRGDADIVAHAVGTSSIPPLSRPQ